jgi:hypothetical protein
LGRGRMNEVGGEKLEISGRAMEKKKNKKNKTKQFLVLCIQLKLAIF